LVKSKDKFTTSSSHSTHDNNILDIQSKLSVQIGEFKRCTFEEIEVLTKFKLPRFFEIKEDSIISNAANHLKNLKHSYLILEGYDRIVTSWDIVMKTVR